MWHATFPLFRSEITGKLTIICSSAATAASRNWCCSARPLCPSPRCGANPDTGASECASTDHPCPTSAISGCPNRHIFSSPPTTNSVYVSAIILSFSPSDSCIYDFTALNISVESDGEISIVRNNRNNKKPNQQPQNILLILVLSCKIKESLEPSNNRHQYQNFVSTCIPLTGFSKVKHKSWCFINPDFVKPHSWLPPVSWH